MKQLERHKAKNPIESCAEFRHCANAALQSNIDCGTLSEVHRVYLIVTLLHLIRLRVTSSLKILSARRIYTSDLYRRSIFILLSCNARSTSPRNSNQSSQSWFIPSLGILQPDSLPNLQYFYGICLDT